MSDPPARGPAVQSWLEEASRAAARFIPRGARVLALGAARSTLASHLPPGSELQRWDARSAPGPVDLVVALEALLDPGRAAEELAALRRRGRPVIAALAPATAQSAAASGPLTLDDVLPLVGAAGFARARLTQLGEGAMMRLEPIAPAYRPERSVWVLSYSNLGNFGDRLGQHLISQVLPPNARIRRLHHEPWDAPDGQGPDLLILGVGNSLFQPLLTDELLALMGRAKACVGIFGTQYRDSIDAARLGAVLDRLDAWWARSEADLLLYGRGRPGARHLGDWLIDAFPLARPSLDETLVLGDEVWADQPLDRLIERIQAHSQVVTRRLHPLLCALTSARRVAYNEQRDLSSDGAPSGKFRSMFLDVFGQDRPEGELWEVDATAVADYKTKVRDNVAVLRQSLAQVLA